MKDEREPLQPPDPGSNRRDAAMAEVP